MHEQTDQQISEEQSYREIIRGVSSYIDWHQVPVLGNWASSQDDNLFAGPRKPIAGKITVKLPEASGSARS